MQKISLAAVFAILSINASAVDIRGARIDSKQENLLVDVSFGGGCKKHTFALKLIGCGRSLPAQCTAEVVDTTPGVDPCEALLSQTATFSLKEYGLTDASYAGALLTIFGDRKSSATVTLPSKQRQTEPTPAPTTEQKKVACVTNAGSDMLIDPNTNTVTLESDTGKKAEYTITDVDMISLESNPPIEQTTYKLNDGRSVVISFRGSEKVGTGYYIRLGGNASPEFQSCLKVR